MLWTLPLFLYTISLFSHLSNPSLLRGHILKWQISLRIWTKPTWWTTLIWMRKTMMGRWSLGPKTEGTDSLSACWGLQSVKWQQKVANTGRANVSFHSEPKLSGPVESRGCVPAPKCYSKHLIQWTFIGLLLHARPSAEYFDTVISNL